jgi:hypothetical protein
MRHAEPCDHRQSRERQHGRRIDRQDAIHEMQHSGLLRACILDLARDSLQEARLADGGDPDQQRSQAVQ